MKAFNSLSHDEIGKTLKKQRSYHFSNIKIINQYFFSLAEKQNLTLNKS